MRSSKVFPALAAAAVLFTFTGCAELTGSRTEHEPIKATVTATPAPSESKTEGVEADKARVEQLFKNPTAGSIEKYYESSEDTPELPAGQVTVRSFTENLPDMQLDYSQGRKLTFVAVCDHPEATFVLLRDGKDVANGPCGEVGKIVSYAPPEIPADENPHFSFHVEGADKFEVAVFQVKGI